MRDQNQVTLIGNAGSDPELKYLPSGRGVATFNLATNADYKKDGEWQKKTDWHRVVIWGELAEQVAKKIAKGQNIIVMGKLETRQWSPAGEPDVKRYTTEVIAFYVGVSVTVPKTEGKPSEKIETKKAEEPGTGGTGGEEDIPF